MKTPENTSAIEFEMEEKLKLIKKEIINEDDVGGAYLITLRALVTFLPDVSKIDRGRLCWIIDDYHIRI